MGYVVTAPLVVAKLPSGQQQHVYEGFPLPKGNLEWHTQMLLDEGFIKSDGADESDEGAVVAPEEPPRAGEGSGRDVWAAHAAAVGVEHEEDASRADIIAAVDAAK